MYIPKIGSVIALICVFLSLGCIAQAQFNPGDWSDGNYTRYDANQVVSGAGVATVPGNGSWADAMTPETDGYPTQDYAYATATCDVCFYHNGVGPATLYAAGTYYISGSFANQGYGGSGVWQISDGGTAGHDYNVSQMTGYGPININNTENSVRISFTSSATCHSNGGDTYAQGEIDKNVD